MTENIPRLIEFPSIGSSEFGYITVSESARNIPFDVKRVYWTYYTPQNVQRGHHAHKELQQVIFAVSGRIEVDLEDTRGTKSKFLLESPSIGLYIPRRIWRVIRFSHSAVLLCLASLAFEESDYIRTYEDFKKL